MNPSAPHRVPTLAKLTFLQKRLPEIVCLGVIALFFGYFSSYGSWDFLEPDPQGQGIAYDDMARSLLKGKTEVRATSIPWELFVTHSGLQMYFGPFPALARIPLNFLFPSLEGQWSRASVFAACLLSMIALYCLAGKALAKNPTPLCGASRRFWRLLFTTAFCLGSPLLFLSSTSAIYHEAIAWGLAGFLWSLALAGTPLGGVAASVALLSRLTLGIPALAVHGVTALLQTRAKARILSLLPVALALLFQAWVNTERFGAPWTFVDMNLYKAYRESLAQGSQPHPSLLYGEMNLQRARDQLKTYLLPQKNFSSEFPWVTLASRPMDQRELFEWNEPLLPLPLSAPFPLLLALLGISALLFPKKGPLKPPPLSDSKQVDLLLLGSCLIPIAIALTYHSSANRYTLDALPLLVTLGLLALQNLSQNPRPKILLVLAAGLGLATNTLVSFTWIGGYYLAEVPSRLRQVVPGPIIWRWMYCPPERALEIQTLLESLRDPKPTQPQGRPTNPP